MERSWDHLLKNPVGMGLAMTCSILVLVFIVAGGIFMRLEIHRQRAEREKLKESLEPSIPESD